MLLMSLMAAVGSWPSMFMEPFSYSLVQSVQRGIILMEYVATVTEFTIFFGKIK